MLKLMQGRWRSKRLGTCAFVTRDYTDDRGIQCVEYTVDDGARRWSWYETAVVSWFMQHYDYWPEDDEDKEDGVLLGTWESPYGECARVLGTVICSSGSVEVLYQIVGDPQYRSMVEQDFTNTYEYVSEQK